MNFDFSADQKLLQQTFREFLVARAPLSLCREVLESDAPYAPELWQGIGELGWCGTALPEASGGSGFGYLELALMAEELGRALAPIPFGPTVYGAAEALRIAGNDDQKSRHLEKIAVGARIGTLALTEAPGQNDVENVTASFAGGRLSGTKLPVSDGCVADIAIVAAHSAAGLSLVLVDLNVEGVVREALDSIDPSRPAARLIFDGARAELLGEEGQGEELVARLLDRAAVLMAFEQLGAASRAFEITREFVMGRYAFGRPIGSFQAIKHRLADLWAEIELARSNCFWAAWALAGDESELPIAACCARISATTALDLASTEMIQLHGGVGYTWEYDCHLFYRRARQLGVALGNVSTWRDRLMSRLDAVADSAA